MEVCLAMQIEDRNFVGFVCRVLVHTMCTGNAIERTHIESNIGVVDMVEWSFNRCYYVFAGIKNWFIRILQTIPL